MYKKTSIGCGIFAFLAICVNAVFLWLKSPDANRGNDYFFPNEFLIKNFLHIMCLKRRAFSFENEIRTFIVANNISGHFLNLTNIDFNSGIIKGIRVSPYSPFSYDDPRKEYYNLLQNAEFSAIKSIINNEIPNVEISQSRLYEETKRILTLKK